MDSLDVNHRNERSPVRVCCPFCQSYNHHRLDHKLYSYLCHTCGQIFTTQYYEVHPLERNEIHWRIN